MKEDRSLLRVGPKLTFREDAYAEITSLMHSGRVRRERFGHPHL
jgi:hypothetical protein